MTSAPILRTPDSEKVRALIAAYQAERLHPELPRFRIYHHTNLSWRGTPKTCNPGVYVMYCWRGDLRYVGKASAGRWLNARLNEHFRPMVYNHPVPHHLSVDPPQYVDVVVVNEAYEAPSLEEYLQTNFPDYLHRRFRESDLADPDALALIEPAIDAELLKLRKGAQ